MSTARKCADCGAVRTIHARGLCRRCYLAWKRRTDPVFAERQREISRNWKARNRGRIRQYGRHPCAECGVTISRQARLCQSCARAHRMARRHEIQRRWLAGESLREIAAALDTTANSIGVTLVHMRAAGWDLPYRYQRRRAAA